MLISPPLAFVLFLVGGVAGLLGALLGLGGGVFVVPFFVLVLHLPMHMAVGVSLSHHPREPAGGSCLIPES